MKRIVIMLWIGVGLSAVATAQASGPAERSIASRVVSLELVDERGRAFATYPVLSREAGT